MTKKVLLFSSVEWGWLKQRPHFMAEELAERGCEITYLAIDPKGAKKKQISSRLTVCEISSVRGYMRTPLIRWLACQKIKAALEGEAFDTVILTNPIQLRLLPRKILQQARVIYDCMDLLPAFYTGRQKRLMEKLERELSGRAERITVSAQPLQTVLQKQYGVPAAKFRAIYNAASLKDCEKVAAEKDEKQLQHPALIYIGTIEHWLEMDRLQRFMETHPDVHLYMVGKAEQEQEMQMARIPNCHVTGPLEHTEALRYLKAADVALLPFKPGGLVDMVDPVKMYEYLAMRKPVVASYWPALEHFRSLEGILFYTNDAEFEAAVEQSIRADAVKVSQSFVVNNTWSARAGQMLNVMNEFDQ